MTLPTQVTKGHATGNDFVMYWDPDGAYEPSEKETRWLCDRHFGIGGDGLLRLARTEDMRGLDSSLVEACKAAGAEWFMDYRNADGSIAEMCGNGTRAITLLAQKLGLAAAGSPFALATRAGVKTLTSLGDVPELGQDVFQVEMGAFSRGVIGEYRVTIPGTPGQANGTFVDMGNPHVVAVLGVTASAGEELDGPEYAALNSELAAASLPDVEMLDLVTKPVVNPAIESDQNVEFLAIRALDSQQDQGSAFMRVNERGVGETLSCGTGLCASGVVLQALTGIHQWTIAVRGGRLRVIVRDDNTVTLTGPAAIVGEIQLA
ncbi:MAG: diaminopimelate epimerase [Bifidobacterium tibiigranuli]|jgi:diaminopimelate epimerase|uniref:diaminopimelate epimerase n=1 Tax=Bifidobacterium tibiigranuli TaxID=2172043 RepID=UPI0026F2F7E3|nr:diaminopimelate epimerase [Bifidobacterium tibiigranuli]MCI1673888.1 diaminopimelate epimerase [Bifidobacterium tibiigranuli]MCI1712137.1 diaminopimelate epimerase [Bifidobacterium tibiigranuli]MCI1834249.1 diaminopimelate epimerase [Bifidobacterium tibiigranuli]